MHSGVYRLTVALQDASDRVLDESSVDISVSAVTQWVTENWEEAIEFLAYEASDDERERLEGTPPDQRLEAWREFWEVRDPVPSTPGNEAFENYFRRIAVANANFSTKLRAGWKSDRGRVFVAFGSPSDLIRRPVPSGTFPIEIWVYDAQGFQIVFEDRIGFGNYQIANPGTFANELAALDRRKHRAIRERRAAREGQQPEDDGGRTGAPAGAPGDSVEPAETIPS
jgi:GWxTD domain-containing protein